MANNMTIGPALAIGGNTVELTTKGKVQVTNPEGKIKTLSQDEFKKQLIKNADKIENGEDFEFKSGNAKKALTIAGAAVGTAAVVAGVIYRKKVANFVKNFDVKKTWQSVKDFFSNTAKKVAKIFKKEKQTRTIFDSEKTTNATMGGVEGLEARLTSKETQAVKNSTIAKMANADAEAFEASVQELKNNHSSVQKELNKALGLRKGQKDTVEIIPRRYIKADGSVMSKAEQQAIDKTL